MEQCRRGGRVLLAAEQYRLFKSTAIFCKRIAHLHDADNISMERPRGRLPLPNHTNFIPHNDRFHCTNHSQRGLQPNAQCNSQSSTPKVSWNDLWQHLHDGMEAQVENNRDYSTPIEVGLGQDDYSHYFSIWECHVVEK